MAWREFRVFRRCRAGVLTVTFWALGWVLAVAVAPSPFAATPQAIPAGSQEALVLTDQLEYLSDPTGQWRPGAPLPGAGFAPLTQRWSRDNFGTREADIWFKTTLEATRLGAGPWLWVVANPHLERVSVLVVHNGRQELRWVGGNTAPGRIDRVREHPFQIVPLDLQPGGSYTVYMHVQSRGIVYVPVSLWRPSGFWQADQVRYVLAGLYFGLAAGLFAYNLLLYMLIQERVYLYYRGCILLLTLAQLANTGLGAQYLWPAWVASSTFLHNLAIAGAAACAVLFARAFLGTAGQSPRIDRWLLIALAAWLATLCALPLVDDVVAGHVLAPTGILTVALLMAATLHAVGASRPGARYFALAWVTLLVAGALFALLRLGWLPYSPLLANVMMLGSAVELVLLSFALADRIRSERLAKERAIADGTAEAVRREEAQRALQEKSRFMAALAHDIQQPLYAIGLATESMARHPASSVFAAPLSQMQSAMQSADELLVSLAMAVKLDSADLRPVISNHSVQQMLERIDMLFAPLAQQRGLDWRVTPSLTRVQSDPALLERMVCNLVANALRYTERGGVMLACRVRHNGLLLQVWDTGPGITVQERQTVFNEHFRGAAGRVGDRGMGLGLSIVRRCAHLLGIEVGLRSEVGRGSCFYLLVPLAIHPD